MVTITPNPAAGPVVNPGKGWVAYGEPQGMSQEVIDLASIGYRRFEWWQLEPEEGAFDWARIDDFISEWAKHGKQVAFGVMNESSHSKSPDGYVTPKWVYDAGVEAKTWEIKPGADGPSGNPGWKRKPANYLDPIFMEKLENFVKVMAARYDGSPSIAFIDIRSYGNWGETMNVKHSEIYLKYFKKTRLCNSTQHGHKETKWCAERGIAVRRDGIGGSKGQELTPAAGQVPAIFEFWGPLDYLKKRNWWRDGKLIQEAVEIGMPTYVEIIRGSPEFIQDYRPLIDNITNRIGFHFILKKAVFPQQVHLGKRVSIRLDWRNEGVAPIYVPCVTKVALIDDEDNIVAVSILKGSNPSSWAPGKSLVESAEAVFEDPKLNGSYRLAIGLFHSVTDKNPSFRLGIETDLVKKWHILGSVTVN